jgi:hypothetical protein
MQAIKIGGYWMPAFAGMTPKFLAKAWHDDRV